MTHSQLSLFAQSRRVVATGTALAVLAVALLTGCTPGAADPTAVPTAAPTSVAPVTTPTAVPTATAAPAPVAASVVVSVSSITVLDASNTVLADIPFTTPGDLAAAQLEAVLGAAPSVVVAEQGHCRRAGTIYTWGGLVLDGAGDIMMARSGVFTVSLRGTATDGGVGLYGPGSARVGMTYAEITSIPGAIVDGDGAANGTINLQAVPGAESGPDQAGVLAVVLDNQVRSIGAPVYIYDGC